MLHGFEGLQDDGKFEPLSKTSNIFNGQELPLHYHISKKYRNMTPDELDHVSDPIGHAKGCGPDQILYWQQGGVVGRGRKHE